MIRKDARIEIRLASAEHAALLTLAEAEGGVTRLILRWLARALTDAGLPLPVLPEHPPDARRRAHAEREAERARDFAPDAHGIVPSAALVARRKRAKACALTLPLDVRARAGAKRRRAAKMRAA